MIRNLYLGNCLEVMPELPSGLYQAIITDLPYGTTQNKWDSPIDLPTMWLEVKRILKPGGVFITTASQPFSSTLVASNLSWYKHEWIWIKNRGSNFANTVREPMKEHESVLVFSPGKWKYNKQMQERTGSGLSRIGYVINPSTASDNYGDLSNKQSTKYGELRVPSSWQKFNTEVGSHPTQKPVALYEYMVRTYTDEGDEVLDICMGSATTGIACVNLCRNFTGIELSDEYYDKAKARMELATLQPALST